MQQASSFINSTAQSLLHVVNEAVVALVVAFQGLLFSPQNERVSFIVDGICCSLSARVDMICFHIVRGAVFPGLSLGLAPAFDSLCSCRLRNCLVNTTTLAIIFHIFPQKLLRCRSLPGMSVLSLVSRSTFCRGGPASTKSTVTVASSLKRLAKGHPALPAPTTMKSNVA